jgi:hypothetical protein
MARRKSARPGVTDKNNANRLITSHRLHEFGRVRRTGIAVRLPAVRPKLHEEWPTALGALTSTCAEVSPSTITAAALFDPEMDGSTAAQYSQAFGIDPKRRMISQSKANAPGPRTRISRAANQYVYGLAP